jgi:hypothetical protein
MSASNDPRARELNQLKLALATFALQLDAFELQAHGVLLSMGQPGDDRPGRGARNGDRVVRQ